MRITDCIVTVGAFGEFSQLTTPSSLCTQQTTAHQSTRPACQRRWPGSRSRSRTSHHHLPIPPIMAAERPNRTHPPRHRPPPRRTRYPAVAHRVRSARTHHAHTRHARRLLCRRQRWERGGQGVGGQGEGRDGGTEKSGGVGGGGWCGGEWGLPDEGTYQMLV